MATVSVTYTSLLDFKQKVQTFVNTIFFIMSYKEWTNDSMSNRFNVWKLHAKDHFVYDNIFEHIF